jgi:ATP-dependent Clp protease adaptor protein ClpS
MGPDLRRPARGLSPLGSPLRSGLNVAPTAASRTLWLATGRVAPEEVEERISEGGSGSKVFLFNCECHTFDEVITQLLKAVPGMTRPLAEELAWRVHTTGLAEVYRGGASDCDRVARILGETGLIVQVM